MFFEILLLSVVVVTAYLGPMMVRRLPPGNRLYGWMLLIDLGLALVSFAARQDHASGGRDSTADLLGVIAIGGAVCLILVPPILRDLGRRALTRDRLRLAMWLTDLRELLQPGLGARAEREVIEAIVAVRSGRVEEAVETLRETKNALENPLAKRQLDERIVLTYLYARDWARAITHFETYLDTPGRLSPQLVVEMVRAYCEAGELGRAAELVETLERSPLATEPILALLVARSRLVFLAFVGRTTAVDAIVAAGGPLSAMPAAAREFWSGIARMNAGDRTGARSSLEQAARLSGRDKRARDLAERVLSSLDDPGVVGPHPVPAPVAELADRLTAATTRAEGAPPQPRPAPRLAGVGLRAVPVTVGLVAANIAVSMLIGVVFGSTGDVGALVIAGANLKAAVAAGEWWRLPASMFLHVGLFHLVLNMYGLWILGRLVEQMVGSVRYFAIYMASGLIGAAASFAFGAPGLSAGASGAVFGVLGAAVAELALRRKDYPERWRRALLGNLVFLTVANVAIGFYYTAIDQSAHMGGLVAGAALAALLSRRGRIGDSNLVRAIALALAVVGGGSIAYAAFGVATTSYAETVASYPWRTVEAHGMRWEQPEPWDEVEMNGFALEQGDADGQLAAYAAREQEDGRQQGVKVTPARGKAWVLPPGWQTRELDLVADSLGGDQHLRAVYFARARPDGLVWTGLVRVPSSLVDGVGPAILRILGSVEQVADKPVGAGADDALPLPEETTP